MSENDRAILGNVFGRCARRSRIAARCRRRVAIEPEGAHKQRLSDAARTASEQFKRAASCQAETSSRGAIRTPRVCSISEALALIRSAAAAIASSLAVQS